MNLLTVRDLNVTLEGVEVLQDLAFDLEHGECLTIIGPNGSGKTVLLKALLGIIPYTGTITWAPNIRFGYVPQKIDADRHLPMNLMDLMLAKKQMLRLDGHEIADTIKDVGIAPETMDRPLGHLSGGQFQRALIAFALLGKPHVLIFDEPTASIDIQGENQIYELLHSIQDKYNLTVILVSHEMSVVFRYASQVLCLNRKRVCYGPPLEVLTPETLKDLYQLPTKFHHHEHNHS